MRWLLGLLLLALALPAAAKPGVAVTVTREKSGDWLVDYRFISTAPVWFFTRSAGDLQGQPWRPQSWTVETPGVKLERIGRYDALTGNGKPLRRVRIRMRPFAHPLSADYTPALAFSDGGLAIYTHHFQLAPAKGRAVVEAMPLDLNGVELDMTSTSLSFRDPGRRMLLLGKTSRGRASLSLDGTDAYLYDGDAKVIDTESFAGVVDSGLPAWARQELDGFMPRLIQLYTDKLGKPGIGRPMVLLAWQGSEKNGYSMGGSVLTGMVVMQISGKQVLSSHPALLAGIRAFLGHESGHFWLGQTIRYARRSDAWITEGGADILSVRGLEQLVPGFSARESLQAKLDECMKLTGPNEPLAQAEERGEHRAHYGCGAMLMLAAESARRRAEPEADGFTFLRELIDAHRAEKSVGLDDWLAHFEKFSGAEAAREVRGFVTSGAPVPAEFWARLFALTGVPVTYEGGTLKLL